MDIEGDLVAVLGDVPVVQAVVENPHDPDVVDAVVALIDAHLREDWDGLSAFERDRLDGLRAGLAARKLTQLGLDAASVRDATRAELVRCGLPLPPPHLPSVVGAVAGARRTTAEAVARVRTLGLVLEVAYGAPVEPIEAQLEERALTAYVSDDERRMLDLVATGREDGERLRTQITWRSECLYALGWALGLFSELPLAGQYVSAVEDWRRLVPDGTASDPAYVMLRPEDELVACLDRFYCAHWAARERQLTGRPAAWPADVEPGVVWERRHALEWLLSDRPWDALSLDT